MNKNFLIGLCLIFSISSKAQSWDVNYTDNTYKKVSFNTNEGTWLNLDVSPNGKTIVFDLLGDIYSISSEGGEAKKLKGGQAMEVQPRFSPDGSKILYTSDAGGGDNIWMMDADGGNAKQLSKENFRLLNNADWMPDGEYFIAKKHFTSTRSLGAGELWMYNINGGDGIALTARKNDQQDLNEPSISPDGRYIYYSEDVYPGGAFQYNKDANKVIFQIKRFDTKSGKIKVISNGSGSAFRPQVSPNGKNLAFIKRIRTNTILFIKDLETGIETPIFDKLSKDQTEAWTLYGVYSGFDWMPNNEEIIIWAKGKIQKININIPNESTEIPFNCKVELAIAPALRIKQDIDPNNFNPKVIRYAVMSPDKEYLVFNSCGHLYKKKLPNGTPVRLTKETDFENEPSFSIDGKSLVYTTWNDEDEGSIKIMDFPNGKSIRTINKSKGIYRTPSFSNDNSKITFYKENGSDILGFAYTMQTGIYTMDLNSGEEHFITENGTHPRFSRDGTKIYYQVGGELFGSIEKSFNSINLNGYDDRSLVKSKYAGQFVLSDDEKYIAFSHLQSYYVAPFPHTGLEIDLNAESKLLPIKKVSEYAGINLQWVDRNLVYTVGDQLFVIPLNDLFKNENVNKDSTLKFDQYSLPIALSLEVPKPSSEYLLKNAEIITMNDKDEILKGYDILIKSNKIISIGKNLNDGNAKILDCAGKTIIPGFIDAHAHAIHFRNGISPNKHWPYYCALAFGTTTIHDPSANSETVFAQSELVKSGETVGPRVFSTGTILYGADGDFKAVINSIDDAKNAIKRNSSYGAFSVKSYNQPRREQRQMIIKAARELNVMVVPEGGSTFYHNLSMILDGHTTIEHNIPIAPLYRDVQQIWQHSNTSYTPTLIVNYGGINGEYYWYQKTNVWENERLMLFTPRPIIDMRARDRMKIPEDEYEAGFISTSKACKALNDLGVKVNTGAHGQIQGIGEHWEIWMLQMGGMSNLEALKAATINPAKTFGFDDQIGSIEEGKLADLLILDKNPLEDIKNTQSIRYTIANGIVYDAETMQNENKKRSKFYWEIDNNKQYFDYPINSKSQQLIKCSCQTFH